MSFTLHVLVLDICIVVMESVYTGYIHTNSVTTSQAVVSQVVLTGCPTDARVSHRNLSVVLHSGIKSEVRSLVTRMAEKQVFSRSILTEARIWKKKSISIYRKHSGVVGPQASWRFYQRDFLSKSNDQKSSLSKDVCVVRLVAKKLLCKHGLTGSQAIHDYSPLWAQSEDGHLSTSYGLHTVFQSCSFLVLTEASL